jgi:hypothetical protein
MARTTCITGILQKSRCHRECSVCWRRSFSVR